MRLRHGESREGMSAGQNLGHAMKNLATEGPARGRLGEVWHHESGQTTVVMTLFLVTFLTGFIAMGIDVESLFAARRQAQAAADAAAIAAAEESPSVTNEQNAAWAVAALNGFDHLAAVNPAVVTVLQKPSTGNYASASTGAYLEVQVSMPFRTFFGGILTHKTTMVVAARAVSGAGLTSPSCVCLESTSGTDLNLSNNSKMTPNGCGTTVDSSSSNAVTIVGSATLGGLAIGSVATNWDNGNNVHDSGSVASGTKVVQGIPAGCSPPVPVAPTYNPALCTAEPTGGAWGNFDVGPYSAYGNTQSSGVVCYKGLIVGSNGATVKLEPGVYVISNGTLHFLSGANNASNTGGNGVVFYLTGTANLVIDNGANVNLTAPGSGTYAGIVIFQDPGDSTLTVPRAADTQPISIQGGSNTSFNGAIFAPTSNVTLGNGSGTTLGADLVANTLTMNGGGTLSSTATTNFGTFNVTTAKLGE